MNIQKTALSLALSALIVTLPACCWKNRSCCPKNAAQTEQAEESNRASNDKAITKF